MKRLRKLCLILSLLLLVSVMAGVFTGCETNLDLSGANVSRSENSNVVEDESKNTSQDTSQDVSQSVSQSESQSESQNKGQNTSQNVSGDVIFIMDGGSGDGSSADNPLKAEVVYTYNSKETQPYYKNSVLYQAAEKLKETGGTIVICGEVSIGIEESYGDQRNDRDFIFPENKKPILITSTYNGVDYRKTNNAKLIIETPAHIQMNGESIWENIEIQTKGTGRVIACGNYKTIFGEGIICTNSENKQPSPENATYFVGIAGSGRYESPETKQNTNIIVKSGTYNKIAGSLWGIYSSRNYYKFTGDSNITIEGNTVVLSGIAGGCNANNSYQEGNVNITFNGGVIYGRVEGTNKMGFRNRDAVVNIKINGGDFTNCTGILGGFNGNTTFYQPYTSTIDFSGCPSDKYENITKLLSNKYELSTKNYSQGFNEFILPSGERLAIKDDEANKNMEKKDINALRQEVVDYMYSMSQVKWVPSTTFTLQNGNLYNLTFHEGMTYYGLPYSSTRVAQLEEFESYIENGIYVGPTDVKIAPGNHCTSSIFGSWARIGNSVTASWTQNMLPSEGKGVLPVGSYDWKGYNIEKNIDPLTKDIVEATGKEAMFEAYSLLKPGDAVLRRDADWGHARLVSKDTVVERNSDGTINGDKSYIITIEQTNQFDKTSPNRTTYWVNHKYTFNQLYSTGYIPVTCAELITGMVEKPEIKVTPKLTSSSILNNFTGSVTSNYDIFCVKVEIRDGNKNIVYSETKYPITTTRNFSLTNFEEVKTVISGLKSGKYTCTISALIKGDYVDVDTIEFTK